MPPGSLHPYDPVNVKLRALKQPTYSRVVASPGTLRGSRFHRRTGGREGRGGRDLLGLAPPPGSPKASFQAFSCAPKGRRTTKNSRTSRPHVLPVNLGGLRH